MEDIEAATLDDVRDFFRTYYVPNNAVLTICGDFDPRQTLELVERYFGEIPPGGSPPVVEGNPDLPLRIGETVREEVAADVPLPRVYLAARVPPFTGEHFYPGEVAASILGTGKAARLYRRLVRDRRIAKDVAAFLFPLQMGAGMLLLQATGYPGADPRALEAALGEELDGLVHVEPAELDRAVAMTETHLLREVQRVGRRADLLSMFDQFFDDPGRLSTEVDRLRAVTAEDVERFAAEYLGPDNRAILTYVPRGAE